MKIPVGTPARDARDAGVSKKVEGGKNGRDSSRRLATLKILQVNVNRCRFAHDLLHVALERENIDIALLQEPNKGIAGTSLPYKDSDCDVGILVSSKQIEILGKGSGRGFCWIKTGSYVIYNCYFSPNKTADEFSEWLGELGLDAGKKGNARIIIAGDFNSKSPMWGGNINDERGEILESWLAEKNFVTVNTGEDPTRMRGNSASWIDVTIVNERAAADVRDWKVLPDESGSDHNYITFEVNAENPEHSEPRIPKLNVNQQKRLGETIGQRILETEHLTPTEFYKICEKEYKNTITKTTKCGQKRGVYWWNEGIKQEIAKCKRARREIMRARRKNEMGKISNKISEYNKLKRNLKIQIENEKKFKWEELLEDLESDTWGKAYLIATKRFGQHKRDPIEPQKLSEIVRCLFPTKPFIQGKNPPEEDSTKAEPFTKEEIEYSITKIKNKKAPGLDDVTREVLQAIFAVAPEKILHMLNELLDKGMYPKEWKITRLTLIKKTGRSGHSPKDYRPICLVNTIAKVYEQLILKRMKENITESIISDNQHGFVKNRSTLTAIEEVVKYAKWQKEGTWRTSKYVALILIDTENAFNSAKWEIIEGKVMEGKYECNLKKIIKDYLSNRYISTETESFRMTCGVPQGSVLGPTLWNIMFNPIIKKDLGENCKVVAYADDVAIVVAEDCEETLHKKISYIINETRKRLKEIDLNMAEHKTEIVYLTGRKKMMKNSKEFKELESMNRTSVKYLGVHLDKNLSFGTHIIRTTEKAKKTITNLAKLMPRIKGPSTSKRKVIASVVTSQLLYGSEIWAEVTKMELYKRMLLSVQRTIAIRVVRGYRTISTNAALAIAGMIPIHLLAQERKEIFDGKLGKKEAREQTIEKWEKEFREGESRIGKIIPCLREWINRKHGVTNFHLVQLLTGHGCFGTFRQRIGKTEKADCWYCGEEDNPDHMFTCTRWTSDKIDLDLKCKEEVRANNFLTIMLKQEDLWDATNEFVEKVLKEKERYERILQKEEAGRNT